LLNELFWYVFLPHSVYTASKKTSGEPVVQSLKNNIKDLFEN